MMISRERIDTFPTYYELINVFQYLLPNKKDYTIICFLVQFHLFNKILHKKIMNYLFYSTGYVKSLIQFILISFSHNLTFTLFFLN